MTSNIGLMKQTVAKDVTNLQRKFLSDNKKENAAAVRDTAMLRRSISRAPGSDPAVWNHTLELIPESLQGKTDKPTNVENALHAVMTLYALHQQGRHDQPMHVNEVGFGKAMRLLAFAEGNDSEAVRRRFQIFLAAGSWSATMHHLRGLIGQLHAARIGLDYAQLWYDLYQLQNPATSNTVRLRWGRDYHSARHEEAIGPSENPETPAE